MVFPALSPQVRLPPNTSDDVDEDPTGNKALWDRGLLNGASQKVRQCARRRYLLLFPKLQKCGGRQNLQRHSGISLFSLLIK